VPPQSDIGIELAFGIDDRQDLLSLRVADGTTVRDAIEQSEIAKHFPEFDVDRMAAGIWGRPVDRQHRLKDGDRLELYRPLVMDPREARRAVAAAAKAGSSAKASS
jgi:hypothetical protein